MECDICSSAFGSNRKATCAFCARASIYDARVGQITTLLDRESLHNKVKTVITPLSKHSSLPLPAGPEYVEVTESAKKLGHERLQAQAEATEERIASILEQAALLRDKIEETRRENEARRVDHVQSRARMKGEREALEVRKPQLVDPVKMDMKRLDHRIGKIHDRTVGGRLKLCRETALLSGLLRRRRKNDGGVVREDYKIGGVPIINLKHLNTAAPDQLSASLENICRLLITCCHYLSVRLPAQITLPHPGHPHPTILSLQSSYHSTETVTPSQSMTQSVSTSRSQHDRRSRPKQRLLHLDHPLPRLAKEDQLTYNLFIEGLVLLAWDIAWLCRTQGVTTIETWDDVCNIGRNLWQLFLANSHSPSPGAESRKPPSSAPPTAPPPGPDVHAPPTFGDYSHGSSSHNLAGPDGIELLRTWSVPALARVADKVKAHLLTEMSGAEWELLDEREWNEEREDEQAVLVGGDGAAAARRSLDTVALGLSVMTAADGAQDDGRSEGGRGWMKVRDRGAGDR